MEVLPLSGCYGTSQIAPSCRLNAPTKLTSGLLILSSTTGIILLIFLAKLLSFAHEGRRLETVSGIPPATTEKTSDVLRGCLLSVLGIGILVHIFFFGCIIRYRKLPSVRIAQPIGQALLSAAGATALAGGCLLAVVPTDFTCALAEPLIFTSITVMGASLVGMAWRVERIVSPITLLGSSENSLGREEKRHILWRQQAKGKLMATLTSLAEFSFQRSSTDAWRRSLSNIRQKVPIISMVKLVILFALPQIVLQTLNLSLSSLRNASAPAPSEQCSRPSGTQWSLWLGAILTVLPFASALLLTSSTGQGAVAIPSVLSEAKAVRNIFCSSAFTAAISGPIIALTSESTSPDAKLYAAFCLLLGAVIPPGHFVVWAKLSPIWYQKEFSIVDKIRSGSNQTTTTPPRIDQRQPERSSILNTGLDNDRQDTAKTALEQGKIYENMGMIDKTIETYNDALAQWRFDRNNLGGETIGSFTTNEVQSFSQKDVCYIVKLLIAKGYCLEKSNPVKSITYFVRALDIFELAPSMENFKDRSTIFPCFHSLFRLLREGKMERNVSFEKDLASRFLRETKNYYDKTHYLCALAIDAEMKARSGSIHLALEQFQVLDKIYLPGRHSSAIRDESGLDICALAHSRCALWHAQNGDDEKSIERCEHVIKMLPTLCYSLENARFATLHAVLVPIIRILKWKDQVDRMRDLYNSHIDPKTIKVEDTRIYSFMRNMHIVLAISEGNYSYDVMDEDVTWVLSEENAEVPHAADLMYASLGWSMNTVAAEVCLSLARMHESSEESQIRLLVEKGLAFSNFVNQNLNKHEVVIWSMANDVNRKVMGELQALANSQGIEFSLFPKRKGLKHESALQRLSQRLKLRAKKILPQKLLLSHENVAFVGLTNDSLPKVFEKALSEEPKYRWKKIHIFYIADSLLEWFSQDNDSLDNDVDYTNLVQKKHTSRSELTSLLSTCTDELCFYELRQHCFFGSFFDWDTPGGYIHISPSIWGINPKRCPAQNFTWNLENDDPDTNYKAYWDGLENLLEDGNPFVEPAKCTSPSVDD